MDSFSGRVVVITGAGAGIGRALAVALASRGSALALADSDADALEETRRLCRGAASVRVDPLDVTDREATQAYAARVAAELDRIDVVLAVAGTIHVGSVMNSEIDDLRRVMDVDLWGVMHTSKAFLPYLIASGGGRLVTVSSAFGLIGVAMHSAYCAAKFGVRGFTEALRQEMLAAGHPVAVTCVYPGGVRTSIMRTGSYAADVDRSAIVSRFDRTIARMEPDAAAARILRGVQAGRAQVFVGLDAHAASFAARIAGPSYPRILSILLKLVRRRR